MIQKTEWEKFFERVKYKPNFKIEYVREIDFDREKVILTMRVPDSRDPRNWEDQPGGAFNISPFGPDDPRRIPLIPVTATFMLEAYHGESYAKSWLRSALRQLEDHELDEWLRLDGELMNDPHAEEEAYRRAG